MTEVIALSDIIADAKRAAQHVEDPALQAAIVALETWQLAASTDLDNLHWVRVNGRTMHHLIDQLEQTISKLRTAAERGPVTLLEASVTRLHSGERLVKWGPVIYWPCTSKRSDTEL